MKVEVKFTVDVDPKGNEPAPVEDAVEQAVTNALQKAAFEGYDHDWNDKLSIVMDSLQVLAKIVD